MKTTPNISKIRLHSLAAILSRPRLKRSGERRSLLTLLLLYRAGYIVGKYISIEKLIEESKETYYEDTAPTAALRRMFCVISAA